MRTPSMRTHTHSKPHLNAGRPKSKCNISVKTMGNLNLGPFSPSHKCSSLTGFHPALVGIVDLRIGVLSQILANLTASCCWNEKRNMQKKWTCKTWSWRTPSLKCVQETNAQRASCMADLVAFFQVNELFPHCPDHHHRVCHRCHQLARPAKKVVAVTLAQIWNKADLSNKIKWFDTYFKTVQRQNYSNITAKPLLSLTTLHAMRETVPSYTHDALLRPWPLSLGSCPEWSWRSWTWFSLLPVPVLSLPDH